MATQSRLRFEFGVGHDFANAVLYSLREHPNCHPSDRGILLPIDEHVWQQVFQKVFPERYDGKNMQSLASYCSYFRLGKHGIGYDKRGKRDFALGSRVKLKDRGKQGLDVSNDPDRSLWPGLESRVRAAEVVSLAMRFMRSHHPHWAEAQKHLSHIATANSEAESTVADAIDDPIRREIFIEAFERKARWARLARKLYGFECMVPGCRFELVKEDRELYIEVHHIQAMYEGGSPNDKLNLSVLCPNHHREVHYATTGRRKQLTRVIRREQKQRLAK